MGKTAQAATSIPNHDDSPAEIFLPTYYFVPGNGAKLPQQRAISCHNQAITGMRLLSKADEAYFIDR